MAGTEYVVKATDAASSVFAKIAASADGLDKQLGDLSKRVATPEVDLEDAKFTAGIISAAKRIDKLSEAMAQPGVDLKDAKFQAEIIKINAQLDRLDAKRVTPEIDIKGGGILDKLLSGAHGLSGGLAGVLPLGIAGGLGIGPLLIGLAQVTGALAAAGAGVGAFAALSIPQFSAVSDALSQIKTDTDAYERATTKASKSLALKHIRQDWADMSGPQRDAVHGIQSLQAEFGKLSAKLAPITFKVFNEGLKIADKLLPDLLPFARAAGNAIDGLLKSLNKFVTPIKQSVKPVGEMGSKLTSISAIPPPTGFQKFLTTLQALSGPAITALGKGLGQIAIAVGKLIIVAASPDSIKTLTRVLGFLAAAINVVTWAINRASGNMQKWVDIAHQTANKFDEFRHDTAVVFAAVAAIFDEARHRVATWGHDIQAVFNALSRAAGDAWHILWHGILGATIDGIKSQVGWFGKLPGLVLGALRGLGHSLYGFAHAALTEFWNGFKAVAGSIFSWVGNFVSTIWSKVKRFFGINSPSSLFYSAGKNLMLGLFHGIKDNAHHAADAAKAAQASVSGALGGDALANQALARKIFPWPSSQWPPFVNLVMAESGFDRFARNPLSGAYGIAQALPPTKYPPAGQASGGSHAGAQLSWMFNYIAQRYGTPAGAWAHELSAHWYDQGGWLPPGVSLAVNNTGRPERVGGGNTYNINVTAGVGSNPKDVGRQIVGYIKSFEQGSGPGWRR